MVGWWAWNIAWGGSFEIGSPPEIDEDIFAPAAACDEGSVDSCVETAAIALRHGNLDLSDMAALEACTLGRVDHCQPTMACAQGHLPSCAWEDGQPASAVGLLDKCDQGDAPACAYLEQHGLHGGEDVRGLRLPDRVGLDSLVGPDGETVLGEEGGVWRFYQDGERVAELPLPEGVEPFLKPARWTDRELWFPVRVLTHHNDDQYFIGFWRNGQLEPLPRAWRDVDLPEGTSCGGFDRYGAVVVWTCTSRGDELRTWVLRADLDGESLPPIRVDGAWFRVLHHDEASGRTLGLRGREQTLQYAEASDGTLHDLVEDAEAQGPTYRVASDTWVQVDLTTGRFREVVPSYERLRTNRVGDAWIGWEGTTQFRLYRDGTPGPPWIRAAVGQTVRPTGDDRGFVFWRSPSLVVVYAEPPSGRRPRTRFGAFRVPGPLTDVAFPSLDPQRLRKPPPPPPGDGVVTGRLLEADGWPFATFADGLDGRFRRTGLRRDAPFTLFGRRVDLRETAQVDLGPLVDGLDEAPSRPSSRRMQAVPGLEAALLACADGSEAACTAFVEALPPNAEEGFESEIRGDLCGRLRLPCTRDVASSDVVPPDGLELRHDFDLGSFGHRYYNDEPELAGIALDDAGLHAWGPALPFGFVMHVEPGSETDPDWHWVPPAYTAAVSQHGFANHHRIVDEHFVSVGSQVLAQGPAGGSLHIDWTPRREVLVHDDQGVVRWHPRRDRAQFVAAPSQVRRAVSPDGRLAASLAPTGELRIIDLTRGRMLYRHALPDSQDPPTFAFTSRRHLLVCVDGVRHFGRADRTLLERESEPCHHLRVAVDGPVAWIGLGHRLQAHDGATLEPLGEAFGIPIDFLAAHRGWLAVAHGAGIRLFATRRAARLDRAPPDLGGHPRFVGTPPLRDQRSFVLPLREREYAESIAFFVDGKQMPMAWTPDGGLFAEWPKNTAARLVTTDPTLGIGPWGRGVIAPTGTLRTSPVTMTNAEIRFVTEDGAPAANVEVEMGQQWFVSPDGTVGPVSVPAQSLHFEAWDAEGRRASGSVDPRSGPQTVTLEPGRRVRVLARQADGREVPRLYQGTVDRVRIKSDADGWAWVPADASVGKRDGIVRLTRGHLHVRTPHEFTVRRVPDGDYVEHVLSGDQVTVDAGTYRIEAFDPRGEVRGAVVEVNAEEIVDVVLSTVPSRWVDFVLRDRAGWPEVGWAMAFPHQTGEAPHTDVAGRVPMRLSIGSHRLKVPARPYTFDVVVPPGEGRFEVVVPPELTE